MGIGPIGQSWLRRMWGQAFFRFLVIGAVNTTFGYGVYALFIVVGLPRFVALLATVIIGVLFNFVTTGSVVFGNRAAGLLPRFVAVYGASYVFNLCLLEAFCRAGGVDSLSGQALSLPFVVLFNYWAMKTLVFRGGERHGIVS